MVGKTIVRLEYGSIVSVLVAKFVSFSFFRIAKIGVMHKLLFRLQCSVYRGNRQSAHCTHQEALRVRGDEVEYHRLTGIGMKRIVEITSMSNARS